ncbi:LmbU family transcriptional regulator [Streptomyces sp. NPDC059752]|uniref:LmbU family transcriptional regulator n=1 Tax=unclassified Streptomyces TaxID=2593676 RepID=UPI003647876F
MTKARRQADAAAKCIARPATTNTEPVAGGTALRLPPAMPMEEWQEVGRKIFGAADSSAWWLGDWLIYGRTTYPDRYRHAVEETLLDYQTLRNYAWVARRYVPRRRRPTLSFQHHAELAGLPEAEQEHWMDRAERLNWSKSFLRSRVRAARLGEEPVPAVEPAEPRVDIQVKLAKDRQTRWSHAASAANQDLQTWAMSILDDAAELVLELRPASA